MYMFSKSPDNADKPDIEYIIKEHRKKYVCDDDDNVFRITVRRTNILDDAIASLKTGFDEKAKLKVCFLGESGVDEGGLKREFFTLAMAEIGRNNYLLDGSFNRRIVRHNINAFEVFCNIIKMN